MKTGLLLASIALYSLSVTSLLTRHALAVVNVSSEGTVIEHLIEPPESGCTTIKKEPTIDEIKTVRRAIQNAIAHEGPGSRHHYHAILELYASQELSFDDVITLLSVSIDAARSKSTSVASFAKLVKAHITRR